VSQGALVCPSRLLSYTNDTDVPHKGHILGMGNAPLCSARGKGPSLLEQLPDEILLEIVLACAHVPRAVGHTRRASKRLAALCDDERVWRRMFDLDPLFRPPHYHKGLGGFANCDPVDGERYWPLGRHATQWGASWRTAFQCRRLLHPLSTSFVVTIDNDKKRWAPPCNGIAAIYFSQREILYCGMLDPMGRPHGYGICIVLLKVARSAHKSNTTATVATLTGVPPRWIKDRAAGWYEGQFVCGVRHGQGRWVDFLFSGNTSTNCPCAARTGPHTETSSPCEAMHLTEGALRYMSPIAGSVLEDCASTRMCYYRGQWLDDQIDGTGRAYYTDDIGRALHLPILTYDGQWLCGKWHGVGCVDILQHRRISHVGYFVRGVAHGRGLIIASMVDNQSHGPNVAYVITSPNGPDQHAPIAFDGTIVDGVWQKGITLYGNGAVRFTLGPQSQGFLRQASGEIVHGAWNGPHGGGIVLDQDHHLEPAARALVASLTLPTKEQMADLMGYIDVERMRRLYHSIDAICGSHASDDNRPIAAALDLCRVDASDSKDAVDRGRAHRGSLEWDMSDVMRAAQMPASCLMTSQATFKAMISLSQYGDALAVVPDRKRQTREYRAYHNWTSRPCGHVYSSGPLYVHRGCDIVHTGRAGDQRTYRCGVAPDWVAPGLCSAPWHTHRIDYSDGSRLLFVWVNDTMLRIKTFEVSPTCPDERFASHLFARSNWRFDRIAPSPDETHGQLQWIFWPNDKASSEYALFVGYVLSGHGPWSPAAYAHLRNRLCV